VTSHLVGITEIAGMLEVSRQRVYQLIDAYPDFPAPEVELSSGRVWSRAKVAQWSSRHSDRRPGRPRQSS